MADRFVMLLGGLLVADEFVLVAKYFLFGFKELKVRRSSLWKFVVILDFEFTRHWP